MITSLVCMNYKNVVLLTSIFLALLYLTGYFYKKSNTATQKQTHELILGSDNDCRSIQYLIRLVHLPSIPGIDECR